MYNSPIDLLITEVTNKFVKEQDEAIFKSVLNFVPNVDRTELLQALQYDRNQYEKGYADGKADAMAELVRCKDCKYGEYDFTEFNDYYLCRYNGGDWNKGDHFCSYGERKDNA